MTENWIELVIGIWILISPWLLAYSNIPFAKWSSLICGFILIVMNASDILGFNEKK